MKRRRSRSLIRVPARRRRYRTYLVVTNGSVTEWGYFRDLKKFWSLHGLVVKKTRKGTGLLGTARSAILEMEERERAARQKVRDPYDEVWIVCDYDFTTEAQIKKTALLINSCRAVVGLAISNPCFELWLLLHLLDIGRTLTVAEVQTELKKICSSYDSRKKVNFADFCDGIEHAVQRAQRLDRGAGTSFPNPSSGVWRLVERLRADGATISR